jgi:hypothetical protein
MSSTATARSDQEQPPADLFLTERTMSDPHAHRRGRPGKRLVRRDVARTSWQIIRRALKR